MSKSYDKALTRLILILTKLSNDERPTTKELSEEFNIGIRTVQRDIYERLAYFPIEKDREERLKFIDGFSLDRSTLENDEMLLVYLSLSQIKSINKSFESKVDNIFSKLLRPNFNSTYHIKVQAFEKLDLDSNILKSINFSIENQYISEIYIKNLPIRIEPYKIVSFNGIWYLFAKELKSQKIRSYLLSNIAKIENTNSKFILEKDIDEILSNVHSAWFDHGIEFKVKVLIDSKVSYIFKLKSLFPTQEIIKENDDKSLIVSFTVSHYEDIDNIIKSWLPDIKVIEPIEYHSQIENELQNYLLELENIHTFFK